MRMNRLPLTKRVQILAMLCEGSPTSSSWMNLAERFFRDLTEFITEKSFASTRELADAIVAFLAARNENPQRYEWKAKGEDIPAQDRCCQTGARRAPASK